VASLSESPAAVRGISKASLDASIAARGEGAIPAQMRYDALARFEELPVRQALRGGRDWKHDLSKLDFSAIELAGVPPIMKITAQLGNRGALVTPFDAAHAEHADAFAALFGRGVDTRDDKFASLALAFQQGGAFVWIPDGVQIAEPIEIGHEFASGSFPYTLIGLGRGASATVIERFAGAPFACGICEIVLADGANLQYAVDERLDATGRTIFTRRAALGRDSSLNLATAELGGEHAVERIRIDASQPGSSTEVTAFFFANGDQHVDIASEVVHAAASTRSQTVVRSAGTERGQGRYYGNIKILPEAHGTDASLRDDALLLSEHAHVDSVPALEIAANDVKAFHGATVGAISAEEIFYAQTRGLSRAEAERMIALGFFEPAIARFPTGALREELRRALEAKFGASDQSTQ
jgi:Fe-S cluster assembly scaffold protein SufB